jgi:hypothetical protein
MGECNYYLKARFKDSEAAAFAVPRLSALLAEGERAYQYWQGSRRFNGPTVPDSAFWAGFRERFPLVIGYLRELAGRTDWGNGLSGHLGCLVDPRPKGLLDHRASLVQSGDLLLLQLNLIWHGTDMGLLEHYCWADLGAIAVGSVSEEDLDVDEDSDLDEDAPRKPGIDPFEAIWL